MVITYHGGQCFKVSFGGTTFAYNPISKQSKLEAVKFGADVALVSLWHPDFNGVAQVSHGSKQPFVIDGPGEFEVGELTVRGFGVPTTYAGVSTYNTIYHVTFEDMQLVFLGALGSDELESDILRELGEIDILFVPIAGGDLLTVPQASKLAVKLEAHLVIPMQYDAATLKAFLKEESKESVKPVDKLTIKRKEVQAMSGEVAVLKS